MNAIEFSNKYSRTVKEFFTKCAEYEPIEPNKIGDITVCLSDRRFELRLETTDYSYSQEFDVNEKEIIPLYFDTH